MLIFLVVVAVALYIYVEWNKPPRRVFPPFPSQLPRASAASAPRYRPASLFSSAESNFFAELSARYQGRAWIFSKVRLADLASPAGGPYTSEWHTAFNRISSKHVDFVICRLDLVPLCVVELDDRSHARQSRQERDYFVDHVLQDVGLPVFHVPVCSSYSSTYFESIDKVLKNNLVS